MDCASLERYLEAYLEGRLRRPQWLVLRRHVMICPHCRARVEQLRQFEVELHGRFRAMARTQRLWTGLELDLVNQANAANSSNGLPPKPPRPPMVTLSSALSLPAAKSGQGDPDIEQDQRGREPRWPILAALCLVLVGVGTGGWFLIGPGFGLQGNVPASLQHLQGATEINAAASVNAVGSGVPVMTDAPGRIVDPLDPSGIDVAPAAVAHWLKDRLGKAVDLALPASSVVLGGRALKVGESFRPAVLVATEAAGRLLILPTLDGMASASADIAAYARANGLHHTIRRQGAATFDVVGSALPAVLDEALLAAAPAG